MTEFSPDYRGNQPRSTLALAEWLRSAEPAPVVDAKVPIVDLRHHLFGAAGDSLFYDIDDIRNDLASWHRVIGTVYVEAYESGWRTSGPQSLRPIGVGEFRARRSSAAGGRLLQWEIDLRALAARPNLGMKIDGMGMPLYGFRLDLRDIPARDIVLAACWRPLIEPCISIFR